MALYFSIAIILSLAFAVTWHFVKQKRISVRQIESDYALMQQHRSLNWTMFILPAILFGAGLIGKASFFLISIAASLAISEIIDWVLTRKFHYKAFLISGNNLIQNDFKCKTFNLQELTIINFLPFGDTLQLRFQGGESISIHRPDFDKYLLSSFFKTAIEKSTLHVVIAEDAKSKIQILEETLVTDSLAKYK